jgi:hypothetical protein
MRDDLSPIDPRYWFTKASPKASVNGSVNSPANGSASSFVDELDIFEPDVGTARSARPNNGQEHPDSSPPSSPPLSFAKIGRSVRLRNDTAARWDWSNADFAWTFLHWLGKRNPEIIGNYIPVPDIKEIFPLFQQECGCRHLKVGSLLRGLRAVTECSDKGTYVDRTGRRRGVTEYLVPPAERA